MKRERIESLDLLRGLAIMLIILFHSSIYNFANIHRLDFSNPPLIVVLMSFMGLWGGLIIIYSMTLNTIMLGERTRDGMNFKPFYFSIVAGVIYIGVHYLLNLFLGRWNVHFVNNRPVLTLTAYFLRNGSFSAPAVMKLFDGSSIGTIGLNLILLSLALYLVFRKGTMDRTIWFYPAAGATAIIIMLLSFVRVLCPSLFCSADRIRKLFHGTGAEFSSGEPISSSPYLAYGIFGMMMGLMVFQEKDHLLKRIMIPLGVFFIIYGLTGMMSFEKTISKPDYFWYFKTSFELGLFVLMVVLCRFFPSPGSIFLSKLPLIRWFSRVSLTIYLLETTLSELVRIAGSALLPGWNETINGCLAFGAINIVIWSVILFSGKNQGSGTASSISG